MDHSIFIPNDMAGSRRDTAVLLTGTATEFGISQKSIRTTPSGFFVTEELVEAIDADSEDEPESEDESSTSTKTSGNRAGKNSKKEK